jgi:hypothetical protein
MKYVIDTGALPLSYAGDATMPRRLRWVVRLPRES